MSDNKTLHPAIKHDMLVNAGALKMALNVLRRAGKDEVADELEKTAMPVADHPIYGKAVIPKEMTKEEIISFITIVNKNYNDSNINYTFDVLKQRERKTDSVFVYDPNTPLKFE
jgi:propanediol dehydratase small subunit